MQYKVYGISVSHQSEKYHYVYRITNIVMRKHYYGKRSSTDYPLNDIGQTYLSSSTDDLFMQDQLSNPQNYSYKVVRIFESSELAYKFEREVHLKFDVGQNPKFYNKIISGGVPYSSNMVTVRDKTGKTKSITKEEFATSSEYIGVMNGITTLRKDGATIAVPVSDKQIYIDDGWVHWMNNKTMFIDEFGRVVIVSVDDAESRGLRGVNFGKVPVQDRYGNKFVTSVDDERIKSGELFCIVGQPNVTTFKHSVTGHRAKLRIDDPRVLSGEYVGISKGMVVPEERKEKLRKTYSDPDFKKFHFAQSRLLVVYAVDGSVIFHVDTGTTNLEQVCLKYGITPRFIDLYKNGKEIFTDLANPQTRGARISAGKLNRKSPNWRRFIGCSFDLFEFNTREERATFIENNPDLEKLFDCV